MVREGMAWAFTRLSVAYVDQQEEARIANRGVHEHDCVPACLRGSGVRSSERGR
jgi:endonuclease YncB( thermonuclease family)